MRTDYDLGTLWENVKIKYKQRGKPLPKRLQLAHRLVQWWLVKEGR